MYPKIKTKLLDTDSVSGSWVLTEKLHGAHVQVCSENGKVRIGKRKALLEDDELHAFFGIDRIYPDLFVHAQRINDILGHQDWVLYGELVGEGYPGPNAVQQDVYYSPYLMFVAFDLLVKNVWIDYNNFQDICEQIGLHTPPLLGKGKFNVLSNHSVEFESLFAKSIHLEPLENNFAEGWVLKPAKAMAKDSRPILKKKRSSFQERSGSKPQIKDYKIEDWLMVEAVNRITPGRFSSARSKVGANSHQVIKEVQIDILEELENEVGALQTDIKNELLEIIEDTAYYLVRDV